MPLWKAVFIILEQKNETLADEEEEDEEESEEVEFYPPRIPVRSPSLYFLTLF